MAESECPEPLKPFRWKPGQSGNPKGRPKKKTFEELVETLLEEATVKLGEVDISCREAVAGRLIEMLLVGNERALVAYLDRAWPKTLRHEVDLPGVGLDALDAALDRFRSEAESGVPRRPNGNGAT